MTRAEKGYLLDDLLRSRPELAEPAEELARLRLTEQDRDAVAEDVESALGGHDIEELNGHAGYHPGRGYVHPGEAAAGILDESLQPFLDDLTRRANLGYSSAAIEVAAGVLRGCLPGCRIRDTPGVHPDYPIERAGDLIDECAKLGVALPINDLLDLVPEWSRFLHPTTGKSPR
jgi:hypothetical protein